MATMQKLTKRQAEVLAILEAGKDGSAYLSWGRFGGYVVTRRGESPIRLVDSVADGIVHMLKRVRIDGRVVQVHKSSELPTHEAK